MNISLLNTKTFTFIFLFLMFVFPLITRASTFGISRPANNLGLVGYWTFDGKDTPWTSSTAATTLDKSGNGNTGTLTNMAQATSPVAGKIGQGLKFVEASSQYVSVPNHSSLQLSGSWTLAMWVNPSSLPSSGDLFTLISKSANSNYTNYNLQIDNGLVSGGLGWVVYFDQVGSNSHFAKYTTSISTNTWYHVTGVWDSSLQKLYVYLNGSQVASSDQPFTPASSSGLALSLAEESCCGGGYKFDGSMDDVRIYSRALSASEISQLYQLGQSKQSVSTNPLQSGLVGYWTFDGKDTPWTDATTATTIDRSGNGNTGTLTSMAQATSPVAGKIGQGLNFDGVNDNVSIGTPSALNTGATGSYSVWINSRSVSGIVFGRGNWDADRNSAWIEQTDFFGGSKIFCEIGNSSAYNSILGGTNLNTNTWYMVTCTWDGSLMKMYINGVSDATPVSQTLTPDTSGQNIYVGRITTGAGANYFNGKVDDVRVYNRALSATEILQLYQLGR